jgi:hypothetical protein
MKILIILTSISTACLSGTAVVMIIAQYYGFSISSPFTCSPSYFTTKYTTSNLFLSASFVGTIFALTFTLVHLLLLIVGLLKVNKEEGEGEVEANKIIHNNIARFYCSLVLGMMGAIVPMGYFISIILEVTKKCDLSINLYWLIITGTAALAEILSSINIGILLNLNSKLDEAPEETKDIK